MFHPTHEPEDSDQPAAANVQATPYTANEEAVR
jgi:hypothetical protein